MKLTKKMFFLRGRRGGREGGREGGKAYVPGAVVTGGVLEGAGAIPTEDVAPRVLDDDQEGCQLPL